MPGNIIGHSLRLTSWGESHGLFVGGVLDGIPPGLQLNMEAVHLFLNRRRPGQPLTTPRTEADELQILSGVFEGRTTGTPLSFQVANKDAKPQEYAPVRSVYRPGHGDYSYHKKYGHVDYRGGGRASARETVVRVAAGAIAHQILTHFLSPSFFIKGAIVQLGEKKINRSQWNWESISQNIFSCPDQESIPLWTTYLEESKEAGLSLGALIEVQAHGIPAGLGEPVYDKLDADLCKALMSINAVKGVEIGDGFDCVSAPCGYDEMQLKNEDISFLTNRSGGILAGISTGAPLICRAAFKPTSSTKNPRQSVTKTGENIILSLAGRHDPCVALRAVPIVETMVAFTLADHLLRHRAQCGLDNFS